MTSKLVYADAADDALPVGLRSGAGQRFADAYGPFREDSMELMEEKVYQRGMLEQIRENTQALGLYQSPARRREEPDSGEHYSSQGEAFGTLHGTDGVGQPRHVTVWWDDLSTVYRPKPTYYELGQKVSTRPVPPPPRTYTKFFSTTTGAYPGESNHTSRDYHTAAPSSHFGGWANRYPLHPSAPDEFSDWHLINTSRTQYLPLPPPPPPPHIILPLLGTGQPLQRYGGGYHGDGYDRNVGNGDPRKLSLDVNVYQVESDHPEGQRSSGGQGQRSSGGQGQPDGRLRPYVPPLGLDQPRAIPQLNNQVTSAPAGSAHHLSSFNRQPWTDRPVGVEPVYPYRSMKNPWFPKPDNLPPPPPPPPHSVRHHYRRGKYGYYRVFDINDYKKLQKELRLGSLVGEEKDFETIEDKKEKKAILSEYGRLVRAKNRQEMNPNYSFAA